MIRSFKEKFFENFEVYQEQFRSWWSGLASRERIILIGASSLLGVVLLFAAGQQVIQIVSSSLSGENVSERVADAESQIQKLKGLQRMARRYDNLSGAISENFDFEAEAQKRARRSGLQLESVKPSSSKSLMANPKDKLFEVKVTKGANLDQSLRFLDALESVLGIRLINLSLKPSFKDKSNFEIVATFAVAEELQ